MLRSSLRRSREKFEFGVVRDMGYLHVRAALVPRYDLGDVRECLTGTRIAE